MSTKLVTPIAAMMVTTLWNRRVGRSTIPAITASTTSDQISPFQPVIAPVELVNQLLAFLKKCPPAPMPMIRPVIWMFRSTSGTSNAMIAMDAITSVHDSSQPTNGPTMRVVKT